MISIHYLPYLPYLCKKSIYMEATEKKERTVIHLQMGDVHEYYGSIANIAQQLGVHRNTVNYQLGRVKELFGFTLDETKKAELTLAFRILKLNEKGHLL